ncbi:VOC family protein [Botrimarina hoheduenensis]|uniref:Glyoxalase-like domain protein n=1 Tax=Botrimarina hoheduenensis TaxID=2528000 RepID=A0A5C5VXD6_9BACT|nr:VOC family protein [Botrimarina hoheduenensis]TWT43276.1 Glyoxalase-like domain protein [Botrimarina hoheduenensis]
MADSKRSDHRSLTPYLIVADGDAAIQRYAAAFGAQVIMRLRGAAGQIAHAELRLGEAALMLAQATPDMKVAVTPTDHWPTVSLMLSVDDCDAAYARAMAAGLTTEQPPTDWFYGERSAKLRDPDGHRWSLTCTTEALTEAEIQQRLNALSSEAAESE